MAPVLLLLSAFLSQSPEPARPAEAQTADTASFVAADATAAIDKGLAAFARTRYSAARDQFQKAVEADPKSAAAHFYLGYSIYKLCEPKRPNHPDKARAAEEFSRAYELDPAFRPVWARKAAEPAPAK